MVVEPCGSERNAGGHGQVLLVVVVEEEWFDRLPNMRAILKAKGRLGFVLAGLERVHGLARDHEVLGQRALATSRAFAQFAQAVVHRRPLTSSAG
jgi:hypothetical protein